MTFKEIIEKAKENGDKITIKFIKVTNNQERTATFSTEANVDFKFDEDVRVGPKTLKAIMKNHDRVYTQEQEVVGALFTFPEELKDGEWQWRRLYVEQILEIKKNDQVIFRNDDPLAFKLLEKKNIETVVTREELDKIEQQKAEIAAQQMRSEEKYRQFHKKCVEVAKTLSEKDCAEDLGYANGWGDDVMICAKDIKHNWLTKTNPENHNMKETHTVRGDHHVYCSCGYACSWDSSD